MRLDALTARSRLLHDGVVVLSLLAAAAFCVADADGDRSVWSERLTIAVQSTLTIAAAAYFRRLQRKFHQTPSLSPLLLAVMSGSYVWEAIERYAFDSGRPFEALVIFSLKNVMLAMAAVACWGRYGIWALAASLFVAIFSASMTTSSAVQALVALYAVGIMAWLTIAYWESLRCRLISVEGPQEFSRSWAIGALLVVLLLLATIGLGDNGVASSLRGWLPSSGGAGDSDPFARNGVGDGEALVAGTDNITSFAPIDDAPFLQDDKPSLYDIFDETYDEPAPPQNQDRAVSLPAEMASRIKEHLNTRTEKASREFSTLRKSTDSGRKVNDIHSDALFYVAGRTPLHLRLEAYDLFDGITWYPEPESEYRPPIQFIEREGRPWVNARRFSPGFDCFTNTEIHAIKVVNLDTNRIPAPLHLTGVHIANVEKAEMFNWAQDDILQMDRERLPALVPIHLSSALLSRDLLHDESQRLTWGEHHSAYVRNVASSEMTRVAELAARWVKGIPDGWQQVIEIERRLRDSYRHDRNLLVDDGTSWPVSRFLFEERRGPDYQFATAAALMLRSLGYPTRVVSGFYVDPANYDFRSRHTPVHKSDVHFWVEVFLGAGTWATVEPTPGYDILLPPPGFLARLWSAVVGFCAWVAANGVAVSVALLSVVCLFAFRCDVLNVWFTLRWRMVPRTETRRFALATWRLIAWRMKSCGWRRPVGHTVGTWLASEAAIGFPMPQELRRFVHVAEWATFASDATPPAGGIDSVTVCRESAARITRSALRPPRRRNWRSLIDRISGRTTAGSLLPHATHS